MVLRIIHIVQNLSF